MFYYFYRLPSSSYDYIRRLSIQTGYPPLNKYIIRQSSRYALLALTVTNMSSPPTSTSDTPDVTETAVKRRPTAKKSANQERPEEGAPTQKEMPTTYHYKPTEKDQLKIVSWNICSLNSSIKKGMINYILAEQPDIICLQETKLQTTPTTLAAAGLAQLSYTYTYFACSTVQKGYSGTAIFSRVKPSSVAYGLPETDEAKCTEGRSITLEFDHFYLVACYVPNAGSQLVRLDRRQRWDRAMQQYLRRLDKEKPVIWCGDLNVCHHEMDLARPDSNHRSAGFTDEERVGLSNILGISPPPDVASNIANELADKDITSEATGQFVDYVGWRLDYFIASTRLLPRVLASEIRDEAYGASDHVPIMLLLDIKDWSMTQATTTDAAAATIGNTADNETTRIIIAATNKTVIKSAKPVNALTSWLKKPESTSTASSTSFESK
ncbi:Endonuclease/exonuclease/phosphatase [Syncephalis plumigaleata]|nr:Endonuclease/exonuclease/phosphatase [Syncephalis plumigaleata]